jgi:hypothetical protein
MVAVDAAVLDVAVSEKLVPLASVVDAVAHKDDVPVGDGRKFFEEIAAAGVVLIVAECVFWNLRKCAETNECQQ